jgi:hypothetical protein
VADPEGPSTTKKTNPSLTASGIASVAFDPDISTWTKSDWETGLATAFKDLGAKLGLHFGNKIRIHVYGSRGPKRGATADYSSNDKVIRLSTAKKGSKEALAHELGHAIDDKMGGWYGTGGHHIDELVSAFRKTPQGMRESKRLADERSGGAVGGQSEVFGFLTSRGRGKPRASRHTSWQNKPEEIFARCFETYIAEKVPSWQQDGWAKKVIDEDSFAMVRPLLDKMLKDPKVKKAIGNIIDERLFA